MLTKGVLNKLIHTLIFALVAIAPLMAVENQVCISCHESQTPALVKEWQFSRHGQAQVGCVDCHETEESDIDAWFHMGTYVSPLVTPKDCAQCHLREFNEFTSSHHARAGEIVASLDNVLAEKAAGMPGNIADAVNGCWQCHGSIVKYKRDASGNIMRTGSYGKLVLDPDTWPNSGMGRLNPDGSKGSCHACHSRHAFQAKLSRSPENCGKCHMGPDHPQLEIFNESKHGIAFQANRDRMALDKRGEWVLGHDYSAAPTCSTCHISSYMTPQGIRIANSHDVGERISWTLRPVVSTKLNLVIYEDGYRDDFPDTKPLPDIGETVDTIEMIAENEELKRKTVKRKVAEIITWEQRRDQMVGVCLNCHGQTHVNNFYKQFDDLVVLYNEKFAKPSQKIMNALLEDGVLNKNAPFEHEIQWIFWELWHHEGRRARHGASMMGPDYTHWHGMYEVAKHFYLDFLPEVLTITADKDLSIRTKYENLVRDLLSQEEHIWKQGLTPEEAERLRRTYEERYDQ